MTEARVHYLPLVAFLFQLQVFALWVVAATLTWLLLLIPQDHILYALAVAGYIVFSIVFFSYGFDIVEYTALGHATAPSFTKALSGSRQRLLRQITVLALGFTLIEFTPLTLQWVTISFLLAVAPAISSAIVFHEPLARALNPIRIWLFISNMGFGYMALRLMTTSVLLLCLFVASGEFDLSGTTEGKALLSGGAVLLVLMMFRATGTLLHIQRDILGIRTEFSTEQQEQGIRDLERANAATFMDQVKSEFRSKGTESAYRLLELELKRHKFRDDALFYELLKEMADRRLLYRFAGGYIGRLIGQETSYAWTVLLEMHRESRGAFQLRSGSDLLRLAETAATRDERLVLLELMEKFEQDFPKHPSVRQAWLSATELALHLNDQVRAKAHFSRLNAMAGKLDEAQLERCRVQLDS